MLNLSLYVYFNIFSKLLQIISHFLSVRKLHFRKNPDVMQTKKETDTLIIGLFVLEMAGFVYML